MVNTNLLGISCRGSHVGGSIPAYFGVKTHSALTVPMWHPVRSARGSSFLKIKVMNIKWKTFDYEGRSFKEGLCGTFNSTTFCTSYTDHPLFMILAKFRIWIRFKILNY